MRVFHSLAYHGLHTEGNWPGQRHRFFRNLSALEWRRLYGHTYVYSSDYIHANRHAFSRSTRCMARAANLLEEAAEILQRTTTWHMRFTGSIIPATLRDLSGKGRFCCRLVQDFEGGRRRHDPVAALLANHLQGESLNRFYDALEQGKVVNRKSQLVCDVASARAAKTIALALEKSGVPAHLLPPRSCVPFLQQALRRADMRTLWNSLSARKKTAYVAGSVWSTGTQLGINILLAVASSSFLASVVGKTLALAGGLYAASFLLRMATTCQARWMHTYRGATGGAPRRYVSRSEYLLGKTRRLRNLLYGSDAKYLKQARVVVAGIDMDAREYRSANFAWHGRGGEACEAERHYAAVLVEGTQRLTDVVYAADSVSSRLIGRLIRSSFCAAQAFEQHAGLTAAGYCQYRWKTHAAADARLGKFRLSLARLIGVGGADTLGAAAACLMVSTVWTVLSKTTGGLGTVLVINGAPVIVPLGSSVVGAIGWACSLAAEALLRAWQVSGKRRPSCSSA